MKFKIFKYDTVNSTNEKAIELIKKKKYENGFVYALSQKKGKGRYGRKWISKKGNFFGSIFFHLKKNYPSVEEFSLINPILNIDILSKYCGRKNTFFKSPNDIYINKKKICGILQEVIIRGSKKYLIVGIGINLFSNPKIKNYQKNSSVEIMTGAIIPKPFDTIVPVEDVKVENITYKNKNISGFALDVFGKEPVEDNFYKQIDDTFNCILTPHISGVTQESNKKISEFITNKLITFFN